MYPSMNPPTNIVVYKNNIENEAPESWLRALRGRDLMRNIDQLFLFTNKVQ